MSQRPWAAVAMALWVVALFAPFHTTPPGAPFAEGHGGLLLLLGWAAPIGFSVAWYANVLFVISLTRMLRDRRPPYLVPISGLVLALTALLPFDEFDTEAGLVLTNMRGPAVWLWILSFAVIVARQALEDILLGRVE